MAERLPTSNEAPTSNGERFDWKPQPKAWRLVRQLVLAFCQRNGFAKQLQASLLNNTGTRMIDWVDHLSVPYSWLLDGQKAEGHFIECGFRKERLGQQQWYFHDDGLFPPIEIVRSRTFRLAIGVESVDDFVKANNLDSAIQGQAGSRFRRSLVAESAESQEQDFATEFYVCERHGWNQWSLCDASELEIRSAKDVMNAFRSRPRLSFKHARQLIQNAVETIGADWACDLFFSAEREFWQSKNHAARVQHQRQAKLGLGWGNHDHHTYRNSRETFSDLIQCLELLGFECRERFYAGGQAGWGAQVLEQPTTGIVIFADVDLSPEELSGDFSHEGLAANEKLGTVGLWCQLHGEAFLQAGMHHLECQFDFDSARSQLADEGIETMQPFTDFHYLRQAFTRGEIWPVEASRIAAALQNGWISRQQADTFRRDGCVGSHLEILERNDGFKGFNQTGVSEIIRKTDPRLLSENAAADQNNAADEQDGRRGDDQS